ncbi:hypothetical protein JQ557_23810 [Bradyrhizobium sp. U87765 SZCCT0131]|uniref:alkaline phosphatase D family protein n=2 Tax=Pseudomonadota TaxID=1224 RepID=UPI001BA936A9|nr:MULTISPECIES: alkaline phosphatase D family protein [unclassified Bradyrhizobium]MBR1221045.1 hypothetical protein [Bradyrhizobium sp. U87765 SZCCT0131]MBR1260135.1 hypothetical protein [Bradyrhizobium sp. U87765 SZCCT0134]MBR1307616.1 hypothetical protein [Bradyrhizobium sp. U87765 SZCCT0110]MBR1321570.1 hypothetical protein [Bradyrhizobium sp. U87765 SZCCT0109]MBR1349883.1 hypothetical protein [Bradyrhizobium sp. U87765 SZCCT0048]
MDKHRRRASGIGRREFLALSAGVSALGVLGPQAGAAPIAPAPPTDGWNQGQLAHLIPTASHDRFLIKVSFKAPLAGTPQLTVDGRHIDGERTDSQGRFWRFDATSLRPATRYELRIVDAGGAPLCDAWPLATFPAPDATPTRMRLVAYTCAGGYDGARWKDKTGFLDMTARQRLLARAMSYRPDAVIANGDHIYWDIETALNKPFARLVREDLWTRFGGALDISVPMLHPRNAAIFLGVCDYQIPGLYGTTLRSTPAFFLTDDHDTFENDEFDTKVATLPPDTYGTLGAEQTQQLYYPEFLPDANRPAWLPGGDKAQAPAGTNITFGTLRYGKLLEAVLYDCRRYVDYKGSHAKILPQWTEDWLVARTRAEDTTHFMHVPSLPFAYSSGKLGDWYPDVLDASGRLVLYEEKAGWQRGWFAQHQRLIAALAAQTRRAGVIVQGDFHASAAGQMTRSGDLSLAHPVHAVMAGTLGTGDLGFPSAYRGIESMPSQLIGMEQALKPTEKNGFTIIDVTPDKMTFTMFLWRPPQPVEDIDTMAPALVYEVPRRA